MGDRTYRINAHECAMLNEVLGRLRSCGANIPSTPHKIDDFLALADRVAKDDALWARLPAVIDGDSKDNLRRTIRLRVDWALG